MSGKYAASDQLKSVSVHCTRKCRSTHCSLSETSSYSLLDRTVFLRFDYSTIRIEKKAHYSSDFTLNVTFITKLHGKNQSQTLLKKKQPMKCLFCCESNQLFELPANNRFN